MNDLKQPCSCFVGKVKRSSGWNTLFNRFFLLISFRISCFAKNSTISNFLEQAFSLLTVGTPDWLSRIALRLIPKKVTKTMYEWSLVIIFFRDWQLTIQTIYKKKKTLILYRSECSRECRKHVSQHISVAIINGWNRDVCPDGMHLIFWRPCILFFQHIWTEKFNFSWHLINICLQTPYHWLLHSHFWSSVGFFLLVFAAWSHSLSVHNGRKNILSLAKRIHGVCETTLLVYYLFVWASCKWKNSITLSIILL